MLEKIFKLSKFKTTPKIEIIAGITTFMTMGYILIVNPDILSATGMDKGAIFTATALSAFIATMIMALYANKPFALASGMVSYVLLKFLTGKGKNVTVIGYIVAVLFILKYIFL